MKPIQYCPKNDKLGTRQVHADIAREYPDVKQQRKGCIKECKTCRRQPFVKVGKKLICADTPEQLYEQLTLLIRKQDDKPEKSEKSERKKLKKKLKKKIKQQKEESNTKKDKKLKKQQKAAKKTAAKSKEKSKLSKVSDQSNPNKKRKIS